MSENELEVPKDKSMSPEPITGNENAIELYKTVLGLFDTLNSIPPDRRTEQTPSGINPVQRFYENKQSKFRQATTVQVSIGKEYEADKNAVKDHIDDFSIIVNTGESDFFGSSANAYRLEFQKRNDELHIGVGNGIYSGFDYPIVLDIVINDKGESSLGSRTNKDWLSENKSDGLLVGINNLTMNVLPILTKGFAADVSHKFKLREPPQIQESLQILEGMMVKAPFETDHQALVELKRRSNSLPDQTGQ